MQQLSMSTIPGKHLGYSMSPVVMCLCHIVPSPAEPTSGTSGECAAENSSSPVGNQTLSCGDNNVSESASQRPHSPATHPRTTDTHTSSANGHPEEFTDTGRLEDAGCCIRSPPPSYSGPPGQPLFLPYITQQLPHYTDIIDQRPGQSPHNQTRVGFIGHRGQYTPVQIPGYISTEDHHNHVHHPVSSQDVGKAHKR